MEKIFTKKNVYWMLLICSAFIAVYSLVSAIVDLADGANVFSALPRMIWVVLTMALIFVGVLLKKENYFACGILLASPFVISAFTSAFSNIASLFDMFDFITFYPIAILFFALASLCVAAGFILWLLNKFFGMKIDRKFMVYLGLGAAFMYFMGFIFFIVAGAKDELRFTFMDYILPFSNIAYVTMFLALVYRDKEPKVEKKAQPQVEEKPEAEKVEE